MASRISLKNQRQSYWFSTHSSKACFPGTVPHWSLITSSTHDMTHNTGQKWVQASKCSFINVSFILVLFPYEIDFSLLHCFCPEKYLPWGKHTHTHNRNKLWEIWPVKPASLEVRSGCWHFNFILDVWVPKVEKSLEEHTFKTRRQAFERTSGHTILI